MDIDQIVDLYLPDILNRLNEALDGQRKKSREDCTPEEIAVRLAYSAAHHMARRLARLRETLMIEHPEWPAGSPGIVGDFTQADRDGDNVPSDRVRAYAEAIGDWLVSGPGGSIDIEDAARAVMAVADREQAALRAEPTEEPS